MRQSELEGKFLNHKDNMQTVHDAIIANERLNQSRSYDIVLSPDSELAELD